MHELDRQKIILSAVQEKSVATVSELVELTSSSEATIRRDVSSLHLAKKLRRVRGGAEALLPPAQSPLAGRPFSVNRTMHVVEKRAIAREAVALCKDGDDVIINGGTSTYQMVHLLTSKRMHIFTNSFAIAEHLLQHSKKPIPSALTTSAIRISSACAEENAMVPATNAADKSLVVFFIV